MHLSSRFCILVTFWSVLEFYNALFPILLGFIFMYCDCCLKIFTKMVDLGCRVFDLGSLLLLFFVALGLGIRVLKSRVLRDGFRSKRVCNDVYLVKVAKVDHSLDEFHEANEEFEDAEFSVTELRKMVKAEKRKSDAALKELEKERMAAASAAEEAMAMIFRLQNEKSALQIEVSQLQRWAEEKQTYDEEVIQSLQWTVMQYEYEEERRLKVNQQDGVSSSLCTPCLSESRLAGRKIDDLRIGSLDLGFATAELDPN